MRSAALVVLLILFLLCAQCASNNQNQNRNQNQNQKITVVKGPVELDDFERSYLGSQPYVDFALELANTRRKDVVPPPALETLCVPLHRIALVDNLLASPFAAPLYAQRRLRDVGAARESVEDALMSTFNCFTDFSDYPYYVRMPELGRNPFNAVKELDERLSANDVLALQNQFDKIPQAAQRQVAALLQALKRASTLQARAIRGLEAGELKRVRELLPLFFGEGEKFSVADRPRQSMLEAIEISRLARKIDFRQLFLAALTVSRAIDRALPDLIIASKHAGGGILFEHQFDFGRVVIGGIGAQVYDRDCALLIDFGGNDLYSNDAGGSFWVEGGVSVVIDVSGDDNYVAARPCCQGAGVLGVGALVDIRGNDTYTAKIYSQGAGFLGIGILYDREGDDEYRGAVLCQGAAAFGAGLVLEGSGNDSYESAFLSQAAGATMGVGAIIERGGDDFYRCAAGAQGFGMGVRPSSTFREYAFYGGLGMLFELGGNDRYDCGQFGQGAGFFLGAGVLVEEGGDDTYAGRDRCTAGAGEHQGFGMLIDKAGNDVYSSKEQSVGFASDRAVGLLLDVEGYDRYVCAEEPGGVARAEGAKAFALVIDFAGNDTYESPAPQGAAPGSVCPPFEPGEQSAAVFIDLGGDDRYSRTGANNSNWIQYGLGAAIDTEGRLDPAPYAYLFNERIVGVDGAHGEGMESPNAFERFTAASQYVFNFNNEFDRLFKYLDDPVPAVRRAAFEPIIDKLCGSKWGTESFDVEFERALFAENQSPRPKSVVAVTGAEGYGLLFTSFYADVRLSAAIVAAHSRDRGAVEHLLKALGDADASVRSSAAAALGAVADKKTLPPLINALCAERNPFVRRSIVSALGNFKEEDAVVLLLDSLRDENAVVRASACRSLERNAAREDSATIYPLLKDRDEYVRRAASVAIMKINPAMEGWGAAYVAAEFLDNVNPEVRDDALNALKGFSRQDFGVDKKKWLDWLDKNRPRESG